MQASLTRTRRNPTVSKCLFISSSDIPRLQVYYDCVSEPFQRHAIWPTSLMHEKRNIQPITCYCFHFHSKSLESRTYMFVTPVHATVVPNRSEQKTALSPILRSRAAKSRTALKLLAARALSNFDSLQFCRVRESGQEHPKIEST